MGRARSIDFHFWSRQCARRLPETSLAFATVIYLIDMLKPDCGTAFVAAFIWAPAARNSWRAAAFFLVLSLFCGLAVSLLGSVSQALPKDSNSVMTLCLLALLVL